MIGRNVYNWIRTKVLKIKSDEQLNINDETNTTRGYIQVGPNGLSIYGKNSLYLLAQSGYGTVVRLLLPSSDNYYPSGLATKRWKSIYIGTDGIFTDGKITSSIEKFVNVARYKGTEDPNSDSIAGVDGDVCFYENTETGVIKMYMHNGTEWRSI